MFAFGSGVMTITPSSYPSTPLNIGLLQEGSIDMSQTVKELFAQNQDAVAIGAGTRKWTGKAKVGRFSLQVLNALMFGGSIVNSQLAPAFEARSVPGVSAYTITVNNAATFSSDQGVVYSASGLPLAKAPIMASQATLTASGNGTTATITFASQAVYPAVGSTITVAGVTPAGYNATAVVTASGPTFVSYANATTGAQTVAGTVVGVIQKGQYSVNTATGVYTFAAGDASALVTISYNYTVASVGQTVAIPQRLLGQTLIFGLNFTAIDPTTSQTIVGNFPNCVCEKFSFGTKLEDFAMPEIDFRLFAPGGVGIGTFSTFDGM